MEMRILVVGGGIAGLTAATALAQKGASVDLVEVRAQISDQGGVGLTLIGNAMAALAQIGVAEQCVEIGMPADSMIFRNVQGQELARPPIDRIGGPEWPGGTGISRSGFHAVLRRAAEKAGVNLRCNVTTQDIDNQEDAAHVTFTDGGTGRYDLVVVADGIYSKTRRHVFGDIVNPEFTGQAIWRAGVRRPEQYVTTNLIMGGPAGLVGFCPINKQDAYIYLVEGAPGNPWHDPAQLHEILREKLRPYGGFAQELSPQLINPAQVKYNPLEWLLAPQPWYKHRMVVIGDAAHANPPTIAQGAAMGIEDAIVLTQSLEGEPTIQDALDAFMRRRYPRASMVVETSCRIARWEVEHTPGADVPGAMAQAQKVLAEPM